MIKLLNSNFYRLKKSMSFWLLLIVMGYLGVFIYDNYNPINTECIDCNYNRLGEVIFLFNSFTCIILPIFTSLFIGTEYSDGGIKNKIIKGHTRTNIYLANLLTTVIVSFIYIIVFLITTNIMGLIWGNHIAIPINDFLILTLDSILLSILTSSLFTFIALSISNKTSSIILSMCIVVWSFMIAPNLSTKISKVSGITKSIYHFILNIIPYGQAYQIANHANSMYEGMNVIVNDPTNQYQILWIYSICLIIFINSYGIYIINKKEIN